MHNRERFSRRPSPYSAERPATLASILRNDRFRERDTSELTLAEHAAEISRQSATRARWSEQDSRSRSRLSMPAVMRVQPKARYYSTTAASSALLSDVRPRQ
jgi:hypothetical protein